MVKWGDVELPGFDAPLVPIEPDRRDALAANIRDHIAEVKRPRQLGKQIVPLPPDEAAQIASGCALCRGFCCRTGGDEAYLNPRSIARVWSARPSLTADELVATYLDAVPERAFKNSCIYHAATGCSLPGSLRSNVCHEYLCAPLRKGLAVDADP